ncbi:hypothetical protein AVEN_137803-1 [Araneus ventricosus]|uniref:Uncharacterized protein n=1 Tax=Araneus ventricosus TaxID=182803 RepID=A0A4Y2PLE9_ARAVE|nr:hypothetical protein AVEN_137803-1 [Araneus ventricosus]
MRGGKFRGFFFKHLSCDGEYFLKEPIAKQRDIFETVCSDLLVTQRVKAVREVELGRHRADRKWMDLRGVDCFDERLKTFVARLATDRNIEIRTFFLIRCLLEYHLLPVTE